VSDLPAGRPTDKILCHRKFYRYVVACMHNCPDPHFCAEFWAFFDARGTTPAEYFNVQGIGERAMRRVVFDCDRCGRKDMPEMFGLYNRDGETEAHRISEQEQIAAVARCGTYANEVTQLSYGLLGQLEKVRGWQHLCDKCFRKVLDSIVGLLTPVKEGVKRPKAAARDEGPTLPLSEGAARPAAVLPAAAEPPVPVPAAAETARPLKPVERPLPGRPIVIHARLMPAPAEPAVAAAPARRGRKPAASPPPAAPEASAEVVPARVPGRKRGASAKAAPAPVPPPKAKGKNPKKVLL
jgi:hypothetical protein